MKPAPDGPAVDAGAPPSVLVERRGNVGLVTLNRPAVLNSIDSTVREQLPAAVRELEGDPRIRAIVLTGAGDRAFCAGADIREFTPPSSLSIARDERRPPWWIDVVAYCRKPVVAAIHGFCLGGGLELALACDIRITAANGVFGLPEVRRGIIPGAGGTQRLSRVIGVGAALRMILTGEQVAAARAYEIGIVSEVVSPGALLDSALELASNIASAGPLALAYAKEAVRRGYELPLAEGLRLEADLAILLQSTEDRIEGMRAFQERRSPEFRGR
jgi:enoyl-CoA hydratase/carnithine racemase